MMNDFPSIRICTDGEGGESFEIHFKDCLILVNRAVDGSFDKMIFKDGKLVSREAQAPISHEDDGKN